MERKILSSKEELLHLNKNWWLEFELLGLYKELFYQCKFVLNSKGKLVVLMRKPGKLDEFASKEGFKLIERRSIWQGQDELFVEVFIIQ